MNYKTLGQSGVSLPEVGLGTWNYQGGPEPLRRGLEAGALFVDTAESYGSEPVIAEAIRGRREHVLLATKVSRDHLSRAEVLAAADGSLRRLETDYIDLYQIHEPNERIPLEETLGAMEELVDAGKVRFIGVSNFSASQLRRAQRAMRKHPIVSNQVRYNLADRTIEPELLPACNAAGVTVIAYSPLGREVQRLQDCDPQGLLNTVARETGKTPCQVALNWCLCHTGVVVIPKGNTVAHILENCAASGWRLTAEQMARLDRGIRFRQRRPFEMALRRLVPGSLGPFLKRCVRKLPAGMRRRLN